MRKKRNQKSATPAPKVDLFLDSGAFSAWSKGHEIDIDDYADFIEEYKDYLTVYANLDVIGDPEATYKNQKYLEDERGLAPLPCFHFNTDIKFLNRYLDEGYEYLALGGMVGTPSKKLMPWLDEMFSKHLTDAKGYPTIKIHGFGITSLKLLLRYPWYSVDSTSWVKTGRFGTVLVPQKENGKYTYGKLPYKVNISDKSPTMEQEGKHFTSFNEHARAEIIEYFEANGYCHKELAEDYKKRDELNILYFLNLERFLPDAPFNKKGIIGNLF